jgi:hypothetical protein
MTANKLSNIPVKAFRKFLVDQGLTLAREGKGRGGHEKWTRGDLDRPITLQSHIDPVPEFIVKQVLRHLKMSRKGFFSTFKS